MRVRLVALTLAIAGVCLFAGSQLPAPAQPQQQQQQQQQAEAIDFDALHAQAQAALTSLQQSRDARVASVASTAF